MGTEPSDEALVERYYGCDGSALDELCRRSRKRLVVLARFAAGHALEGEDVAHELKLLMSKGKPVAYDRGRGASFRTWLYRIATNTLVDFWRGEGRVVTFTALETADDDDDSPSVSEALTADAFSDAPPGAEAALVGRQLREALDDCVAKLLESQRVFLGLSGDGLPLTEIATILGVSNATVTRLKQATFAQLRDCLDRDG